MATFWIINVLSYRLVLSTTKNNVTTLTMNDPKKLNGWTGPMMLTLRDRFVQHAQDPDTKVLILTGADPYYCAGVNLSATIQPMHPRKLHEMIRTSNQAVFDSFLDFPKPIIIAANGPAIGACVTSASLCDAIVASEKATFVVPFARLSIPPEGCSSVHFDRMMGAQAAGKMLNDGWKPTAAEALEIGLVKEVVEHEKLLARAQELGEQWAREGKKKEIPAGGTVEEYKAVNARESLELADAFLSYNFLNVSPSQHSTLSYPLISGPVRVFEEQRKVQPSKRVLHDKNPPATLVQIVIKRFQILYQTFPKCCL